MAVSLALAPRPVRLRAVSLWALSCVVLVGASVLLVDRPVATWSHDVLHRPHPAVLVTKLANWMAFCGLAVLVQVAGLAARLAGRRLGAAWRVALAASLATLIATAAVILLKFGFGRLWPETWVHDNPSWIGGHRYGFLPLHGGEGYESFPSGHTARVTAPFAVLWQRVARLRLLWAVPTLVIAAGLVASDYHFVGDCIAGAYVGVGAAALAMLVFQDQNTLPPP